MNVRQSAKGTRSFKVADGATIDYAVVEKERAGENAPATPHRPERAPARARTTLDLNTLCVDGLGLNVCPSSQSRISVIGRARVGVDGLDATDGSHQQNHSSMSTTPKSTQSKRDVIRALDRQSANICRRCNAILPSDAELDVPGDDRRECPRCRLIQEVPAA